MRNEQRTAQDRYSEAHERRRSGRGRGKQPALQTTILPSPNVPMAVARIFVAERCLNDDVLTLRHWRGTWRQWHRSHWAEIEDREVRALLYAFTENACYIDAEGNMVPWAPTRQKMMELLEAHKA